MRALWLASICGVSLGCGDSLAVAECSGDIELAEIGGTTPTFTWAPVCAAHSLSVIDPADRPTWFVRMPESRNGIAPRVRYGSVPPGAEELQQATPLQVGVFYRVRVFRIEHVDGEFLNILAGELQFEL